MNYFYERSIYDHLFTDHRHLLVVRLIVFFIIVTTLQSQAALYTSKTTRSEKNVMVVLSSNAFSKISVTGMVVDEKNLPLQGVTIKVKGGKAITTTNSNGVFTIDVPDANSILVFSFVGYLTQELTIVAGSEMRVTLLPNQSSLDEITVVGYGTQKKASLTAAVTSINATEIAAIPASNLTNVLAGRLSGTTIQSSAGTPGVSSSFRIRSQSSWNGGDPIFVIDGVVRDHASFDAVDANEIDQITILKDAASAAIYGARSSNGVILLTTKKGKAGKTVINFQSIISTSQPAYMPQYMDISESIKLNQFVNGNTYPSAEEAENVLKWNPKGTAWWDAAYSTPNNQSYKVNVSGGSEKITYSLSGSAYNEKGFLPNVQFKKYNFRGNTTVKATDNLTIGLNLSTSYNDRQRFNWAYDNSENLDNYWIKLTYFGGYTPPYIDGKPVNPGWNHAVEQMRNGGLWKNNNNLIDALVNINYSVPQVPGLSLSAAYSRNINYANVKDFAKQVTLYNFKTTGANGLIYGDEVTGTALNPEPARQYVGYTNFKSNTYQLNGQINYDRYFNKHHISALAVYEQYEGNTNSLSAYRFNFPLYAIPQFFAASGNTDDWNNGANETQDGRLSYIGRINYDYAGKYLISTSIRGDGSLKFAPDRRWGWFPSASFGWVVSQEGFFKRKKSLDFIDLMKLRVSFGSTGNDAVGGWQWQDHYNINGGYYLGSQGVLVPGLTYAGISNPNLTWERSNSYNAGLDVEFFKNFTFTTEAWYKHTYDILGTRIQALPTEFGGDLPAVNYGIVDSRGLEFELGYNGHIGEDFSFSIKGNIGYSTNKVIKRDVAANAQSVNDPNGKTLGYLIGLQSTGIYRTQADLDKLPAGFTEYGQKPVLGMLGYEDVSGPTGTADGKVDDYDMVKLSDYSLSNAPISYGANIGLKYKAFRLDMLFAGLAGFKTFYNDSFGKGFGWWYLQHNTFWNNSYSPTNINGTAPQPFAWGDPKAVYEKANSSFTMYDAGFVRLKNVNLNFTLPNQFVEKLGLSNANLFISGSNLFIISKFKFWDPELPSMTNYPLMKSFSAGLNVNF